MALPDDLAVALRRSLADLRRAHLAGPAWPAVAGDLARLHAAVDHGDADAVGRALVPVAQAAFEGKVRGRLAGADRRAAFVTATKPTSSLPAVGLVCGSAVLVLGYLLGGRLGLAATAVFACFILGVAVAGTRTNADRTEERRRRRVATTQEVVEPAPTAVVEAIARIEAALLA